jgi:hypothetical protein
LPKTEETDILNRELLYIPFLPLLTRFLVWVLTPASTISIALRLTTRSWVGRCGFWLACFPVVWGSGKCVKVEVLVIDLLGTCRWAAALNRGSSCAFPWTPPHSNRRHIPTYNQLRPNQWHVRPGEQRYNPILLNLFMGTAKRWGNSKEVWLIDTLPQVVCRYHWINNVDMFDSGHYRGLLEPIRNDVLGTHLLVHLRSL